MKSTPREEYKIFENRESYLAALQDCLSAGYRPATVAEALHRRIRAIQDESRDEHEKWVEQHFNTSDALAYCQNQVKIVPQPPASTPDEMNQFAQDIYRAAAREMGMELQEKF